MRCLVLLVPLLAAAVASEGSESEPEAVPAPSCEAQCKDSYKGDDEQAGKNLKACEYGCRMFNILDALPTSGGSDGVRSSCNEDCSHAQETSDERIACSSGCGHAVPAADARRKELSNPLDSFFGGLPRIRIAVPVSMGRMGGMLPSLPGGMQLPGMPSMGGIGEMFSKMHGEMDRMMKSLTSQVDKIENGEIPEGSGRLVVVKSGPGYHHQKTYDFGPDGVNTKTEERTTSDKEDKSFAQDMMSAPNPLERFFNLGNDVETFKPKKVSSSSSSSEESSEEKDGGSSEPELRNPFLKAINSLMGESDPELERRENERVEHAIEQAIEQSFDREEQDAPKRRFEPLWEHATDINSHQRRHPEIYVMRQAMCAQKSEDMKWSDWVTCLHLRMGLPRWLTAATISLGIVFVIWLCLVIPQNAPKQKMKNAKAMESQICFANLAMDAPLKDCELPPAYEEIADLHVAISASHESKRKEAEASAGIVSSSSEPTSCKVDVGEQA